MLEKELVIIGGGPGGYVSAIKAAQSGLKVTLIENKHLGGTCLNLGCIPTKALLKSALLLEEIKNSGKFGINVSEITYDLNKIINRKNSIVKQLTGGVSSLLKKNKVEVLLGEVSFKDNKRILANGLELTFKNLIISTGSNPIELKLPGIEKNRIIYSDEALNLSEIPNKMVIVGGGVIAVEMATIFNALGTDVTIVEMMPEILPLIDRELTSLLKKNLEKKGIQILTRAEVVEVLENGVKIKVDNQISNLACDTVLIAAGRKANLDTLNLDKTDIIFDKNGIKVNLRMETNLDGIYAVGDVVATPQLAHVASMEGMVAVDNIMGQKSNMKYKAIPSCVFTNPEIASVGMTEEEVKEAGIEYKVGRFPLLANGKAMVEGCSEGLVKTIVDTEDEEILGVHIMSPQATEMIYQGSFAISMESTVEEMISAIYPHPTISEAVSESALATRGKAIHF